MPLLSSYGRTATILCAGRSGFSAATAGPTISVSAVDHVLASGEDVNIRCLIPRFTQYRRAVVKSTPVAAIAKFAAQGKRTRKKDLGMMAMGYGNVYGPGRHGRR